MEIDTFLDVHNGSVKAEAVGNIVLNDGTASVGKNPATTSNDMAGADSGGPGDEPGRAADIHLHPADKTLDVDISNSSGPISTSTRTTIYGGRPSPGDYTERQRSFAMGEIKGNVRSVVVDESNIYLYNSSPSQTIIIPRPR